MNRLPLLGALLLCACARGTLSAPSPKQDTSIVFPKFFAEESTLIGQPGKNYNLDGASLQALMVAANDFFASATPNQPCWNNPAAHRYLMIRRGDIIFVEIYADLTACDWKFMVDSEARYAISTDGRILRRLAEGEPDGSPPAPPEPHDGGTPDKGAYSSMVGSTAFNMPTVPLPPKGWPHTGPSSSLPPSHMILDGGLPPDAGTALDAGAFPDGGLPHGP